MSMGFWGQLEKPIMALAPMANVTDAAFRRVIAKYGKPDVMFTEFTTCDGLCSPGKKKLLPNLWFTETERPIVAQFFGSKPENFYHCALLAQKLGFDGIDINLGCPDRAVEKQGAGAALMKNPELAKKIIAKTKHGAGKLPVSLKTRLGYDTITLDEWLPHLLEMEPAAITIHARTRKEMSDVPAHWDQIATAVKIRDESKSETLILGNGDIMNIAEVKTKASESSADGVMLGRAIFGNPWLFSGKEAGRDEKMRVMLEHAKLFEELFSGIKSFDVMKKHFKAYVAGWDGARQLRARLMSTETAAEVGLVIP